MNLFIYILSVLAIYCNSVEAHLPYRYNHGFVGYGIDGMQPFCPNGCRDSISGATLNCSSEMPTSWDMTSPECYATDDSFLQTLAWCIHSYCNDTPIWKLEKFWEDDAAGLYYQNQPDPKYTYQEALRRINGTPTVVYTTGPLNQTSVVPQELWYGNYHTAKEWIHQETMQSGYGLVILLSGIIIPIACSLLRFLPIPSIWWSKINAWIIQPPLFGSKYNTPFLFGLGRMPQRGQAIYISYFILLNIVFFSAYYKYFPSNTWYPNDKFGWMCMLVANRFGTLSFANLTLVFLYAGRNNLLLWLSDWSHSTFLLVHRWIAAIAALEAILHSNIYLYRYLKTGEYSTESKVPYWIMGIIAVLSLTIIFPASVLPIRRKFYELFLISHGLIAILVIVGCYWHIVSGYGHKWGYETWIIICMGFWAFDRTFRVLRIARHGIKHANIAVIDDQYVRITVPGVVASGHAYLYFPTLIWRVWENHPFSVASTVLNPPHESPNQEALTEVFGGDIEKQENITQCSLSDATRINRQNSCPSNIENNNKNLQIQFQTGTTFYVRTETGLTKRLRSHEHQTIPILLETGYSSRSPNSISFHAFPILLAFAGGVGITAAIPHLVMHTGYTKLYWGCRSQALVDDVKNMGILPLGNIDHEIYVGKRMDIKKILEETLGDIKSHVCVFVSGPEEMVYEVKNCVGEIVRRENGVRVTLEVEAFSW